MGKTPDLDDMGKTPDLDCREGMIPFTCVYVLN
jgi:hypothetical protein